MIKKPLFIVLGCLLCWGRLLNAQAVHELDLQKSLDIAMEQSYKMRTLKENLLSAEYHLKAATNRFRTNVNLHVNVPNYTETIRAFEDSLGVYYSPIKQATYQTDLMINQPLPTDGRLYLSSGFYNLNDYNKKRQTIQLNTRIGFVQPLEAFYSYSKIKVGLRQAELNYELSKKQLLREQLNLNYEVGQAFYNLVSMIEREKIALQTLTYQREAYELAQNKYKAGVIAEVEVLQMEVDLGEAINNHDIAIANRQSQANFFKQLLGISLQDSLVIHTEIDYHLVEVDEQFAVELGLKNRLEIREQEINTELAEINVRRQKLEGQITGSITAYYDFIGVGESERDILLSTTFRDAAQELKTRPGNKGIALDITIPIWDWGVNRAQVNAARASLCKARYTLDNEKVSVERDIRDTVNKLKSSLKRLQLLEKNVVVAEKSFEISKQRFANGDINSQSMALDRNRLSQARISRLEAYISYKLLLSDLTRKTFYDFEQDRPIMAN
ncbi:MAG: TolC family protein [Candidatus Marinimicrobia bacterium]|nr:TolC family protein [Candidatus Neomarinimicrobiota bacterium]